MDGWMIDSATEGLMRVQKGLGLRDSEVLMKGLLVSAGDQHSLLKW